MSKRAKPSSALGPPPVPGWFVTYADTISLLMTFFVMLMSFSTLDKENYQKVQGRLTAFLGMVGKRTLSRDSLLLRRNLAASRVYLEGYENPPEYDPLNAEGDFEVQVRNASAANILDYRKTDEGYEIHILPDALFEEGTAEFKSDRPTVLEMLSGAVKNLPHRLRVTGHPDAIFLPGSGMETPEQLSLQRALATCRYLSERGGIAPGRLAPAIVIGEGRTLASRKSQVTIVLQRPVRRKNVT